MAGALKKRLLAWQNRLTAAYGSDISTPEARRAAWWHFVLIDHAFLRGFWTNLAEIAPGVWRANQPSPARFVDYKHRLGLKSVLNLRGTPDQGFYLFEREACRILDLKLHDIAFSARRAPPKAQLIKLMDMLPELQKPVLIHCKSGADRTGLVSAVYLMEMEGKSLEEAKKQLSFRFLHLKRTHTGIMDEILELYGAEARGRSFRQWVEEDYDPDRTTEAFALRRGWKR